jgi:hypothetical protein
MKSISLDVWLPFGYCIALSAIALVTHIATGNSDAWIPAFLCFLPMTFWFAVLSEKKTREHLEALEARLDRMEAEKAATPKDR